MRITNSFFLLQTGEMATKLFNKEATDTKKLVSTNSSKIISEGGSKDNSSQIRSRLKAYMDDIKMLQKQLSNLQEQEVSLKNIQDKLLQIQENMGNYSDENNSDLGVGLENTSQALLRLEKSQEKIRNAIAEKLTAQENITANLTVIRDKNYAETIMDKVRDNIAADIDLSLLNQAQLQSESIQSLLV